MHVTRYIVKINRLRVAEKESIKEQVVADIQRTENVALEINAVNKETDYKLKQSSND